MPLLEAGTPRRMLVLLQWKGTHTSFDRNGIDTQSPGKTGRDQRLPAGLLGHSRVGQGSMKGKPLDSSVAETTESRCTSLIEQPGEAR